MSFTYTAIDFDHNDAYPGVNTAATVAIAMVERGNLASTILRVMDTLDHGQGHTIAFNYLDGMGDGAINEVETAMNYGQGYVVATHEVARIKSGHFTDFKTLMRNIERNGKQIALSDGVGLWMDPDTGELVLDTITVHYYREHAMEVGKFYRQHSIYDIIAGEEIIL